MAISNRYKHLEIFGFIVLVAGLGLFMMFQKKELPEIKKTSIGAAEIHTNCENQGQPSLKFDCYELAFTDYMKENGGKKTLELLDEIQKMGGYAQTNCHPLTHKIGNIAFHQYGTVLNAVPEYLPVCHSGYYHGLLEEYLATAKDYETGVHEVCGTADGKVYFNWFQCVHGLGHGIMQYRQNEIPQSVKDCDLIDPGSSAREICYAGVFMENITSDEKTGHPSKYIRPEDPIYPCNAVEAQYKSACYFLASSMILKLNGYDFKDAFKTCETKAETNYRWLCLQSLGRDVSGSTLRHNDKVKELCMLGAPSSRNDCFFGAVRDYINEKGEFDSALGLCEYIPLEYQRSCYEAVMLDLKQYKAGGDYLNYCAQMPKEFESECRLRQVN